MSPYGYSGCATTGDDRTGAGVFTMREAAAVVRELRDTRGWTQAQLAATAHVSRSFVADVEAGKTSVEAAKLFDLFQALGHEVALRDLSSHEVRW